ncbi:sulfatase-like hydrolase/transferase, partial [Myxococcota bacterium]|nr:sulfatase-like hydrolase/transferase [Myxococcota bacterium]
LQGRWLLLIGLLFAPLSLGALGWSAARLGQSQRRLVSVNRDTLLTGAVVGQLSRLGDRDKDGVPRLFAGGDCDDGDPSVRPGVYDPPGDGIDQNCTGADLNLDENPIPPPTRAPLGVKRPWNVLLLTLDAVRYDKLLEHMPQLKALAAQGISFTNAYSQGAATYWSLASLMTSAMPSRLQLGADQTPLPQMLLLTEALNKGGWHTALFANVTVFFIRGLRQGTHVANYDTSHYTIHGAKPGSAHLTDGVLKHLRAWQAGELRPRRDRFFLWAHYYDPHDPYFEVPDYPAEDSTDEARYDAILRYVDVEVARLIQGVRAMGLLDSTLIVITADHGDEFLDHGHRFHGKTLYEEMVHVPLIYLAPGVTPRALSVPASHLEIAPTILDLLGEPVPGGYQGRSRAPELLGGAEAPIEPVYFEVFPDSNYPNHQVGVRRGDLKLIYRIDKNTFELYDLARDPLERDNLYDVDPRAAPLTALLLRYADHHLYWLGQGRTGAKLPPGAPGKSAKRHTPRPQKTPHAVEAQAL